MSHFKYKTLFEKNRKKKKNLTLTKVFLHFFFIVTNFCKQFFTQSTPKGAISKWEGGYDGREESSIDDTPKGPLGHGAGVSRCPCSAGQTATDASVSE